MPAFYNFVRTYEALIYIILAIGALFAFRWLWRSWQESRIAVYRMEREFANRRLAQSIAASLLIVTLFCAEFFLASFILPGLPAETFSIAPTPNFIASPTGTLSPQMMTQFASIPAQTRAPAAEGCVPEQVMITTPNSGDEVKGTVDLNGYANIPSFGFYKLEAAPQGGSTWAIFSAGSKPIKNGLLGKWNTVAVTPGDYQLRLIVTDYQGIAMPPCVIFVRVVPFE